MMTLLYTEKLISDSAVLKKNLRVKMITKTKPVHLIRIKKQYCHSMLLLMVITSTKYGEIKNRYHQLILNLA